MFDIAVIGAGVIGSAITRELSRYDLNIILLEKNNDIATGATKANSAIVHAGYDASHTSKKGRLNALGNRMYSRVCQELSVPFMRVGSLVCAFTQEEIHTLQHLLENGKKLGIPDLQIISAHEIRKKEPNLSEEIKAALLAPSAGITEPWELAVAYTENALENGAELKLNFEVKEITKEGDSFVICSEAEKIQAKIVINCAGVHSDKVYQMITPEPGFVIHPRRGQYFLLDKTAKGLVNSVIFPCPTKLGKGTLVTPTVDGNILIGPDAEDLAEKEREAVETTAKRLQLVRSMASKLIADIPYHQTITTFTGLRAEPSTGDFIIEESKVKGFVNVAGIKSPGLSSAPAIAFEVVDIVKKIKGQLKTKSDFNPVRKPRVKMEKLTDEQKSAMIKKEPRYANIICRCEMISEGEIIDAIHRKAGGRTLNGIKRRVRPGAGRCQGGFCSPRVMEILARELAIDIEEVRKEGVKSVVLTGKTKA
ncbi:MAG: NAD(P)/FAD-dependent oxidoreductase [Spirochaetes bacterium]|nr:NAD(P)/FAD-dependent oxidoreductase [Spirochaetota bacterium]